MISLNLRIFGLSRKILIIKQ